jgi:hypothetical protein
MQKKKKCKIKTTLNESVSLETDFLLRVEALEKKTNLHQNPNPIYK